MTRGEVEPYQDLANAIIIRAAKDYRFYRKYARRHPDDYWAEGEMKKIEKFFKSPWADFLCGEMDATYILDKLKEEV